MLFLLLHTLFAVLALGYGWFAGTRLDRTVVAAVVLALAGTTAANAMLGFSASAPTVLLIDCALLMVVGAVALKSSSHWPVWFAGFQLAAVLFGFAAVLWPTAESAVYHTLAGFFAIPALLFMVLGIFMDRKDAAGLRDETA